MPYHHVEVIKGMPFWNFVENEETDEVELRIEGDITMDDDFWAKLFGIETVTPKGFRAQLAEHKGKDITVWINSYGGAVFAASQIYTALKEHKGNVTVKIDGVAFSAASVIAMAGQEVFMSPTSIMMIHNPLMGVIGEADDMRHAAGVLDEVKETIINAYQLKSHRARSKIAKMMDEETWMSAKKALSEGFIDGMLYLDRPDETQVENAFMFSHREVMNNATAHTKRFIEQYREKLKEMQAPEEDQVNNSDLVSLYQARVRMNKNLIGRLKTCR